ncbi:MAG: 16S rRNA methyltransferase [Rhodothermaceae bacterium]|nr:16S rRNA methyltransferase [Rhodothermaceae bacterium]
MPDATDLTARLLAVQRLLRVEDDGAHVARLADGSHPPEVSRRAVDFVAGVTRQKRWLDFVLAAFVRGRLQDLDPELLQVLRIGAYDLLIRETAPHAAVNEAVETAKAVLHRGAGSLTNGVLRALDRARRAGTLPQPSSGDLADDLAVQFSHPTWTVRRWLDAWGEDATRAFLAASNAPATFTLRLMGGADARAAVTARLADLGVTASPSPWADDFVEVDRLQPILRSGLLDEGTVAVQDVAAGLVVHVLAPQPGERVLDAASAPGGKAVYAALRMGDEGEVAALDVSEAKVGLIAGAARRHGLSSIRPVKADLTTWDGDSAYDRVLLDAPCSGTGVLGKRADLRWRRSPEALAELTDLQDRLLDAAAAHVRPGGVLVYSTCSVEAEENDDRVTAFLARHPGYSLDPVGTLVPAALVDGDVYRALPHAHGTDGAFAARLRRSDP